jgi:hypothetical protein
VYSNGNAQTLMLEDLILQQSSKKNALHVAANDPMI